MATKKTAQVDNTKIIIRVDDVTYTLTPGNLTSAIARQVRQATGQSLQKAMTMLAEDPDLDALAVVVFAAELQEKGEADLTALEQTITYTSDITVEQAEADDEGEA